MRKRNHIVPVALMLFGCLASASAQEKTYRHAFQIGPLSAISGEYNLNYECRFEAKQAFVVGGTFADTREFDGYALSLNYRRYQLPEGQSGFWGLFVNYADLDGSLEVDKKQYPFQSTYFVTGVNWGKRYVWKSGLSVVIRLGFGIPVIDFSWKESDNLPDNHNVVKNIYKLTTAFDGELSIGFCF